MTAGRRAAAASSSLLLLALLAALLLPAPRARSLSAEVICANIPGLLPSQQRFCRARPAVVAVIGAGVRLGRTECRRQFRHRRWNCSAIGSDQVFGHVVTVGSKEAAYTYAIHSAGVTYSVTRACSRGNLTTCGCDPSKEKGTRDPRGGWEWGGCSADVRFGARVARRFLDAREVEGDSRSLMNLHNNKVGRKAVIQSLKTECKCHGVSGSCTMKTCWTTLPPFGSIGDSLMKRFHRAHKAVPFWTRASPKSGGGGTDAVPPLSTAGGGTEAAGMQLRIRRSHRSLRRPRPSELIYLQPSPNYCEPDPAGGSPGTQGRLCNRTSRGTDGCGLLCCGRGYNTHQFVRTRQCNCKFEWCCYVKCDTCSERTEEYTCK